ncbi:MAG: hypothetical protein ABJQ39_04630 [Winogradskyella arenosi]
MKNEFINIRISSDFKADLEILSNTKGISLSNLGREALNEYYNNTPVSEPTKTNLNNDELIQSLAFTEFIFWIYEKKNNPTMSEMDFFYKQHLILIEEMKTHPRFNNKILNEFNKIKDEIEDKLQGFKGYPEVFLFPTENHETSFNYALLADFMYNIRHTTSGVKDLFIK